MEMETLKQALLSFKKPEESSTIEERMEELEKQFKDIATSLFFNGYFECGENHIYISSAELYYNEEDGANPIKDEVMFHTNDKAGLNLPYFKIGHLFAHPWGFDLTFENEEKRYRASVLLKAFVVTKGQEAPCYKSKNIKSSGMLRDYFLNDLSAFEPNNLKVKWVDYHNPIFDFPSFDRELSEPKPRKNVPGDKKEEKLWRFDVAWRTTKK